MPRRKSSARQKSKAGRRHLAAPRKSVRRTGLRVISEAKWGAHFCVFYETTQDLLDTCAAYFAAGLEGNEFCVWVVSKPLTEQQGRRALRKSIPGFERHVAEGRFEILNGYDWYLNGNKFNLQRITGRWIEKLEKALANGFNGMRVCGNAFWLETDSWKDFRAYEEEIDRLLAGHQMIALCTYSLRAARAADLIDVVRAHQFTVARRNGEWEFLETPELKLAKREIKRLNSSLAILTGAFPGHNKLTRREHMTLAHIVRGASSKETGRALGISPRTVEFHRKNIMQKFGAKNTADLLYKVLGER